MITRMWGSAMHDIVSIMERLAQRLAIPVMTPDYEIMIILLQAGPLSAEGLLQRSRLSRASFYHAIGRLKHRCCVEVQPCPVDRRSRTYRLSPRTARLLKDNIRRYCHFDTAASSDKGVLSAFHLADGEIRLPHISAEYQVLLCLFYEPGASSARIARQVTCSDTRFYSVLRTLLQQGLIEAGPSPDKRRKSYVLAGWTAAEIDRTNRLAAAWADELDPAPPRDLYEPDAHPHDARPPDVRPHSGTASA